MAGSSIPLLEVDEVQITTVMDNSFDMLLAGTSVAKRARLGPNPFERPLPIAEHGLSLLIRAELGEKTSTVLYDTGVSPTGILYNMDALEVAVQDIQTVVLSHGHTDHAGGLVGLAERVGERNLPLVLHPEVYLERKLLLPNGGELRLPPPRISDLRKAGVEVIEETGPSLLVEGMVLVSGEIARRTEFEKGIPNHYSLRNGSWEPDPLIHDDQCAVVNVRGKGLVIVTGCGHSGIINIIRNMQVLTGVEKVHAVIGGFHLPVPAFEHAIAPTLSALQEIAPDFIVPGHCTGWVATHAIARTMPGAFIPSSVGTNYIL